MKRITHMFGVFLLGLMCLNTPTASAKPVTSDEVVQMVRFLEQFPLAEEARIIRADLIVWVEETEDVTIRVCNVLGPILDSEVPFGPELFMQSIFGNGAYQLENPENNGNELVLQLAGIESMLRAYREILKTHPNASIPEYDIWLKDLEAGALAERVTPGIEQQCMP